jgi:hypothetical protein
VIVQGIASDSLTDAEIIPAQAQFFMHSRKSKDEYVKH